MLHQQQFLQDDVEGTQELLVGHRGGGGDVGDHLGEEIKIRLRRN